MAKFFVQFFCPHFTLSKFLISWPIAMPSRQFPYLHNMYDSSSGSANPCKRLIWITSLFLFFFFFLTCNIDVTRWSIIRFLQYMLFLLPKVSLCLRPPSRKLHLMYMTVRDIFAWVKRDLIFFRRCKTFQFYNICFYVKHKKQQAIEKRIRYVIYSVQYFPHLLWNSVAIHLSRTLNQELIGRIVLLLKVAFYLK